MATANAGSVFSGWLGPCTGTGPCVVPMPGAVSVSATFAADSAAPLNLDVDRNASSHALSDGLLILRYLFDFTGASLIDGAIGTSAQAADAAAVLTNLVKNRARFDVDGDGTPDALTDGLLIFRYLSGLRGATLINGVVAPGATRKTAPSLRRLILASRCNWGTWRD